MAQFYELLKFLPNGRVNSLVEVCRHEIQMCNNSDSDESISETEENVENVKCYYMFLPYENYEEELYM